MSKKSSRNSSPSPKKVTNEYKELSPDYALDPINKECLSTAHISCCPKWFSLNPYIVEGYRAGYKSYFDLFLSIFKWHNETLNIWTHLIAAVYFGYQAVTFYQEWSTVGIVKFKFESFKKFGLLDKINHQENLKVFGTIFDSGVGLHLFTRLINRFNGEWSPEFKLFWSGSDYDLNKLYNFLQSDVTKLFFKKII